MQLTQSYTQPSSVATTSDGMQFNFSAEQSRPPVQLDALIGNSLSYARIMLAMRQVVLSNLGNKVKDHSAYQAWVQERYLEELPAHLKNMEVGRLKLNEQKNKLKEERKTIESFVKPIRTQIWAARSKYYEWVRKYDREKLFIFDPVISVHPDAVIFECFSQDESSYGRVTVPSNLLQTFGETRFGTTNIDFSAALAAEIYRVRSYRPAWLKVAFEKVELSTDVGAAVEKKIDLPESWVRGFLQVQSASTIEGVSLSLHSQTLAQVIAQLEQRKEKGGPRSIRFLLKKGQAATLVIDPWNIEIKDTLAYQGDFEGEIRIWGRRRLLTLKDLLPYTDQVQVKLLGTGMPSYWTIALDGHRFDLGLSGWTANDWAKKGNFDLIASAGKTLQVDIKQVEKLLIDKLALSPQQVSEVLQINRAAATFALQELCRNGQAMYDHLHNTYRWRQLLNQEMVISNSEEDERQKYAASLVKEGHVTIIDKSSLENGLKEYHLEVQGKNLYKTTLRLDLDGRIRFAECACSFHRRNKLRQGPCAHIMASLIQIAR
ncbi:hypothetical protein GXP67_23795 [Rhodocytophaga rosea]|uniref:SWIM-type domain-containing protein n=1 Tax=Rhodocytophaga rosea TaxID=2704465 RepID=A0A6C0GN31_9BACT|nr:hypothetical protein [Rhodocytophaga rosea]QHT69448.1 hypothetical protein GXP67_23795 [Rhodocytophaga rosea]